jgi:hypothetical protein
LNHFRYRHRNWMVGCDRWQLRHERFC